MKNDRRIVFEILKNQQYSNLALRDYLAHPSYSFIVRLLYTVQQHYESLKFQTQDLLHTKVSQDIEIILVMAAAQYYKMDGVVDYAIVNESVNLAKLVDRKYANLVNAVLKKMIQRDYRISQSEDPLVDLSINFSHPLWIVKLLNAQYGFELTQTLLEHNLTQPPLYARPNPTKISEAELLSNYPIVKENDNLVCLPEIFKTDALDKGYIVIQDINSQQLVNSIEISHPQNVLDACCAPGTKLTQLAIKNQKGLTIGVDLHEHRIELTRQLLSKWGLNEVELVVSDVTEYQPDISFDTILCDVPCSGLGVMRRKPDIKRRIQPEDLDALQLIQIQILEHSSTLLKHGGQLIYSTCTLNKKENEKIVEKFLQNHPELKLVSSETLFGCFNDGDSFYMAHLKRV